MPRSIPWWVGGIAMSLLFFISFSVWGADRPIGASTGMSYLANLIFGLDAENHKYAAMIQESGAWEGVMLIGVFFGGLFMSVFVTKTFHISYIPTLWKERKNSSVKSRMVWSFIAGFMLVFGARLAGGCNAGHILSGGSQIAVSGIIFAVVALGTGMITGRFFYKKKRCKEC
ncbi:YeeE/YedE family protein [Candidatus Sulfurimonas marisnigri]|uniref:YeeE/YedE family protein n=1 Tax=Candidatus Sulfurimonas marisnigri TaxID=2740405 RepID=A0A7S7M0I7_9BACT|nr:YeeE/YedE thiosulfate transporter family protein [Candidatus Sulfurimonas marisnigri]QOY54680.1 YeeE/YedE family protein [Candidatus Sulfurimonas marisnigri]